MAGEGEPMPIDEVARAAVDAVQQGGTPASPRSSYTEEEQQQHYDKGVAHKAEGNAHLKAESYELAITAYDAALTHLAPLLSHISVAAEPSAVLLDARKQTAVVYSNRSLAYLRFEKYGAALADATSALAADSSYIKAHYRRGSAHVALGKFKLAFNDFKAVVLQQPNSKEAREKLKACQKMLQAERFRRAISAPAEVPAHELVARQLREGLAVEADYAGPRLGGENGDEVTDEFIEALVEWQRQQKKLHPRYAYLILMQAYAILSELKALVRVDVPPGSRITVCGDVHGQYYDAVNIFKLNGMPSHDNPYLFNGDFVDRGSFSVEVILLFLALKVRYPAHFHMHRGNHETDSMNRMYGFEGEVKAKYGGSMMDLFAELFNHLPLASVIGGKVFVTHGGLFSRDGVTLAEIEAVSRVRQPPDSGLMCEMLWSDPQRFPGRAPSKRGVGIAFGPDVTHEFLDTNGLEMVVRSHEVKMPGYEVEAGGRLVTIFSAPNYCDQVGNKGGYIVFDDQCKPTYHAFEKVPHPPIKPMAYASSMSMFGL